MEQPIARAPQFRSFSPNILPQTAKNTAVEPGVHGLALGGKFMVHNHSNVKKHDEHALGRAVALPRLLWSWGSWALPLRRLLFSLGFVPVDPTLVPSDDPRHEGWVIQGTLTKLLTNCNTVLFLCGGQKPGHELCSNTVLHSPHTPDSSVVSAGVTMRFPWTDTEGCCRAKRWVTLLGVIGSTRIVTKQKNLLKMTPLMYRII